MFSFVTNKEFKPYAGVWVYPLMLILTPIVAYFIMRGILTIGIKPSHIRPHDEALLVSALVGCTVCLNTIISDGLTRAFMVIVNRVREFFLDLSVGISRKEAAEWYWKDVKTEGAAFWIMLFPMILNALYMVYAFKAYYH